MDVCENPQLGPVLLAGAGILACKITLEGGAQRHRGSDASGSERP
jgi:hypothetical protein